MAFDPTSDGEAIITLSAALNPQAPNKGSDVEERLQNVGTVQLERYEYKDVPVFQVYNTHDSIVTNQLLQERTFLLQLVSLPAVKDSQLLTDKLWLPTASISLDYLNENPRTGPPTEWAVGLNPIFPTVFKCANGGAWVGFLGGRVESFDLKTLKSYMIMDETKVLSECMSLYSTLVPNS